MLKVVAIGDGHVASNWALGPPDEGKKRPGHSVRCRIHERWCESAIGPWHAPDLLVLAGDMVDGQDRKGGGRHQWTTDITEQVATCADLVRLWKPKKIIVAGGSGYHVMLGETGESAEEMLGKTLGAEIYPNQENIPDDAKVRAGPHWFVSAEGTTFHVAHHIAMSRVFAYMSTPIARQMMQAKLNDPMRREWERAYAQPPKIGTEPAVIRNEVDRMQCHTTKLVIRAHAHYYWYCDAGNSGGVILPCWKVPDPFILQRDTMGFTHLGFVGMWFDGPHMSVEKNLFKVEDVQRPPHFVLG